VEGTVRRAVEVVSAAGWAAAVFSAMCAVVRALWVWVVLRAVGRAAVVVLAVVRTEEVLSAGGRAEEVLRAHGRAVEVGGVDGGERRREWGSPCSGRSHLL
jgi:hypothetical protein